MHKKPDSILTKITFHRELLDSGRWHEMTFFDQLGNTGVEVGRVFDAKKSGDQIKFDSAVWRMEELFVMMKADPRWHRSCRLREVGRAQELVKDFLFGSNEYAETPDSLNAYFYPFMVLANEERRKKRAEKKLVSNISFIAT